MKRLSFGLLVIFLWSSQAPGQTPYFQGKTIRIIVGYAKAMMSAELIAEAKKQGFHAEHIPGEDLEALAKEVMSQPADVVTSMKKVMGE